MSVDPRLGLCTEMLPADGDRILETLDRHRPLIIVGDAAGPAARLAGMSTYSMTARLFPNTELVGHGEVPHNPWHVERLEDLPGRLLGALPKPTRQAEADITVGIGIGSGADLYLGGDDWTAAVGRVPVACGRGSFPIGLQGAAVLGSTEVAKAVLSQLGLVVNPIASEFVWNYLDHRCRPAPPIDRPRPAPMRIAILGAGSIGSSVVGVQVMVSEVMGEAVVVDDDQFDGDRNPYRYPSATAATSGLKAEWLGTLLEAAGWEAEHYLGSVGAWVPSRPDPGFAGIAISSVDDVDGRFEVADLLARTTLSLGLNGLALHIQREHLGDGFACPFCEFLNEQPAISQSQSDQILTGIPAQRIEELLLTRGRLTESDLQQAVAVGRIKPETAPTLVGKRFQDLKRRVYADALIPAAGGGAPTPVSAPHVSWAAGVLAAAEVSKAAFGLELVDRRIDLDLSGVPSGRVLKRAKDESGRCACQSPVRKSWMSSL